ncbi:MAG: TIGR03088 family PEP-CTERM/XrtA system glycosyltransferase [Burkholderiales bacterium]
MHLNAPLIVHVLHRFDTGGLENGVVNLINWLPRDKWRHAVLSLTDVASEFCERVERKDVQYIALGKGGGHLLRWYPKLYRLFKSLKPMIVHSRNLAALEASVPAWAAGVPVRVHGEHGWDVHDPGGSARRYQMVRRVYQPFVQQYVALSKDIQRYLEQKVGVPAGKISQIYNGVDISRFKAAHGSRARVSDCPFLHADFYLVGTVGRLEPVKDQVNLARAFVRALELNPAAARRLRLVIVGGGTLRSRIMDVLQRAGVAELAWIPGERKDVADILRSLDCFVLPSLAEGISNTILEAMACGLPVVATNVGGNAELIEDGLSGQLVPPANAEALARAILHYFSDPAVARRHGKTGRRTVETRFALDRMIADYDSMYERLVALAGGRARLMSADQSAGGAVSN